MILQAERNECGLSCVAMLLASHGCFVSLRDLRQQIHHSNQLSLKEITNLLEDHGMASRCLRGEPEDLKTAALPALLHVDMDHYVVLEGVSRNGVSIVDPANGRHELAWREVKRRFTGIVVEATKATQFEGKGKPKHFSVWPLLRALPLGDFRLGLLSILLLTLLVQAFALASPFYLQVMIDEVVMVNNLDMTVVVVSSFLLIHLVSASTQVLRGLTVLMIGTRLSLFLSSAVMSHVFKLSLSYFQTRTVGDLASRFSSLQPLQHFISESVIRIFVDLLMVITTFVVLMTFSLQIAVVVLAGSVFYLILQFGLLQPYRRYQHEYLINEAELHTHFIETLQTMRSLRRGEATGQRRQDWLNRQTDTLNALLVSRKWGLASEIARYLLVGGMSVVVVALAVQDVAASIISIGALYTLTAYASYLTNALVSLTAEWQSYMMLSLHVQRVSDITDAEIDQRKTVCSKTQVHSMTVKNLTCSYGPERLFNVSLHLKKPQSLAIVGASGTGKSSLLSLLIGEGKGESGQGEVMINDQPIFNSHDVGPVMSILTPHDQLIRGSIVDNITFLDVMPDQERMLRSALITGLHESVMSLPLGYQHRLSEQDCALSSGQRQRLLLARAIYRRTDILVLDEATSHLDECGEIELMSRILELGKICIFVTHRRSVATLADKVLQLGDTDSFLVSELVSGNTSANQSKVTANPIAR